VLALVTGVVIAAGRGLLVALLGGSPALAPGRLAAATRTVPLAAVTAAADRERPAAASAEPAMKSGNLKDGGQGSSSHDAGHRRPLVRGLPPDWFCLGLSGPQND